MKDNWKLFEGSLAYGKTMGEFSGSNFLLGGNYVSACIDKNSMVFLPKICLFYYILCRYKLKKRT